MEAAPGKHRHGRQAPRRDGDTGSARGARRQLSPLLFPKAGPDTQSCWPKRWGFSAFPPTFSFSLHGRPSGWTSLAPRRRPRSHGSRAQPARAQRSLSAASAAAEAPALPPAPTRQRGCFLGGGRTRVPPGRARLRPPPPPRPWRPARGRLRPGESRCVPSRPGPSGGAAALEGGKGPACSESLDHHHRPPTCRPPAPSASTERHPRRRHLPLLPAASAAPA